MAFIVFEKDESRAVTLSWDRQECTVELFGRTTLDDAVARAGFIAALPNPFLGLWFEDMNITPQKGGVWRCVANYKSYVLQSNPPQGGASPPPPPPPAPAGTTALGPEYSWDISNSTEHIVKSIATLEKKGVKSDGITVETPKNYYGAIGYVEKTKEIQGVDRIFAKGEFSITKLFDYITLDYFNVVMGLVGSVNNATFYLFPRGELLFLGASGQPRDQGGKVAVTYKFAISKNKTAVNVAPGLTIASKRGWEYIWVAFKTFDDSGKLTTYPAAAYLEQIYEEKDFSTLKIGV